MFSSLFLESVLILQGYNYNIDKNDMIQNYYDHIDINKKEDVV